MRATVKRLWVYKLQLIKAVSCSHTEGGCIIQRKNTDSGVHASSCLFYMLFDILSGRQCIRKPQHPIACLLLSKLKWKVFENILPTLFSIFIFVCTYITAQSRSKGKKTCELGFHNLPYRTQELNLSLHPLGQVFLPSKPWPHRLPL